MAYRPSGLSRQKTFDVYLKQYKGLSFVEKAGSGFQELFGPDSATEERHEMVAGALDAVLVIEIVPNRSIDARGGHDILVAIPAVQGVQYADGKAYNYALTSAETSLWDGGEGFDVVDLGDGDDILIGGTGNDVLEGGQGYDVAIFQNYYWAYTFTRSEEFPDRIEVEDLPSNAYGRVSDGLDIVSGVELFEFKDGVTFAVTLVDAPAGDVGTSGGQFENVTLMGPGNNIVVGTDGDDVITASINTDKLLDLLNGALGEIDAIFGQWMMNESYDLLLKVGADIFDGGIQIDFADWIRNLFPDRTEYDSAYGDVSDFIDNVLGDSFEQDMENIFLDGTNIVHSGEGNDLVYGGRGDDRLFGQGGNDSLLGGAGADWISGGDGVDRLDGGSGSDVLIGGAGNDVIDGGADVDMVWLKGSRDDYLITANGDVITIEGLGEFADQDGTDTVTNIEMVWFEGDFTIGNLEDYVIHPDMSGDAWGA